MCRRLLCRVRTLAAACDTVKHFRTAAEIPPNSVVAPAVYFAPCPGTKPIGSFNDNLFDRRNDVSRLLTAKQWREWADDQSRGGAIGP
jgi:hypothetical protein